MAVDLHTTGIDPLDEANKAWLSDLQGNILRSHGRDHGVHIFITFGPDTAANRAWARDFAKAHVVSAWSQAQATAAFKADPSQSRQLFAGFHLNATGYWALDCKDPSQMPNDLASTFRKGMKASKDPLADPPESEWEEGLRGNLDALVILASDNVDQLNKASDEVLASLTGVAAKTHVETGRRLTQSVGGKELDIEHFGFVDGVSQPLFFKAQIERAQAAGTDQFDPSAPLNLVLVKDPNGTLEDSFGSFLVYRKLREDVPGWDRAVVTLAQQLGVEPGLLAAYAMGRFQDGTPVVLSNTPLSKDDPGNNFGYAGDMEGARCPFHAHTRKTNPRGDTNRLFGETLERERSHRIARRGITYGERGSADAGLLFLCFQADISQQFEFMQGAWANSVQFPKQETGKDPVIGQGDNLPSGQAFPKTYGAGTAGFKRLTFETFVEMKGGEYFFAPSIGFLTGL